MKNTTIFGLSILLTSLGVHAAADRTVSVAGDRTIITKVISIKKVNYRQETWLTKYSPGVDRKEISLHNLNPLPGEQSLIAGMQCTTHATDDNPYGNLDYISLDGRFADKGIGFYLFDKARNFCWAKRVPKMTLLEPKRNDITEGRVKAAHIAWNNNPALWNQYVATKNEGDAAAAELFCLYREKLTPNYQNGLPGCALPTLLQQSKLEAKISREKRESMEREGKELRKALDCATNEEKSYWENVVRADSRKHSKISASSIPELPTPALPESNKNRLSTAVITTASLSTILALSVVAAMKRARQLA